MRLIDVEHLGRSKVIGCWDIDGVLVDPGPESSLRILIEALGDEEPQALLLTHIHLDHAAATGAMVERWPRMPVYVHERGAPHLADPTKLLASASRLYGDRMDELWGRIVAVPEANIRPLEGGESVLGLRVAYTPGHASHHVCFLDESTGTAFVGDVAGCRIPPSETIIPPTPPPDIDIERWEESIELVRQWSPERLALTHFGAVENVDEHLDRTREKLRSEAAAARGRTKAEYEADLEQRLLEEVGPELLPPLLQAVPIDYQWAGLDRYWRKRDEMQAERSAIG